MSKNTAPDVDLASDEPVLYHTGEPAPGNVPARDLTAADLHYLHRVKALAASGGEPVRPATSAQLAALRDDLAEHPAFRKTKPDVAPTEEPAAPAEEN